VGRLGGRVGLGKRHDAFGDVRSQRRDARGACTTTISMSCRRQFDDN
jgi:hypothetical protein